jgi:hypothetical protein
VNSARNVSDIAVAVWFSCAIAAPILLVWLNVRIVRSRVKNWSSNKLFFFVFFMAAQPRKQRARRYAEMIQSYGPVDTEEVDFFTRQQDICQLQIVIAEIVLIALLVSTTAEAISQGQPAYSFIGSTAKSTGGSPA